MFAELNNGKGIELANQLIERAKREQEMVVPKYPLHGIENYEHKQQEYWSALSKAFDSNAAMELVEKSTTDTTEPRRIEWIDYRLVGFVGGGPVAIHVHVVARSKYATGTFAYQLIRRGEKHGVRIVGTLKKGHDVNVLAIYER